MCWISAPGKSIVMMAMMCWLALAQSLPDLPLIAVDSFGAEVKEQIRKAIAETQAKPRDAEANGRLGMVLQTYEQYEQASVCYERARRLSPEEFRWVYYLGIVQAAAGKYSEASQTFQDAIRLKSDYFPAQLRLADALFAEGQVDEARQFYEKTSGFAQASYGLGRIKVAAGDRAAAAEHFKKAIEQFPEYGAAHYALGLALRNLGQTTQAQEHLALSQKFKDLRPPLNDPLLTAIAELNVSGSELLKRGVLFDSAGKLPEAIADHERAIEANPQLVQAHINLISLYARNGQFEKAEKQYQAANAINPNMADSHYNYGVMLTMQQRYGEAATAFERSLQLDPFNAEAHHNYGAMIEREGRLDEAAEHFRRAIEIKPGHRMAHFHLGRILVNQDKLAEAIEQFQKTLIPEDEQTPMFTYALGATYARAGEHTKAVQFLRQALKSATAQGQTQLVTSIERDLRSLEKTN
ncbi:MAG: tetratricopeptide repeat protein [Acidobacteria bacterium]|nr:tetratricopeptide repeat protein [Acidobacteriota bacterium]